MCVTTDLKKRHKKFNDEGKTFPTKEIKTLVPGMKIRILPGISPYTHQMIGGAECFNALQKL